MLIWSRHPVTELCQGRVQRRLYEEGVVACGEETFHELGLHVYRLTVGVNPGKFQPKAPPTIRRGE